MPTALFAALVAKSYAERQATLFATGCWGYVPTSGLQTGDQIRTDMGYGAIRTLAVNPVQPGVPGGEWQVGVDSVDGSGQTDVLVIDDHIFARRPGLDPDGSGAASPLEMPPGHAPYPHSGAVSTRYVRRELLLALIARRKRSRTTA